MNIPDINALSEGLLVELARRKATNGNPGNVREICAEIWPDLDWAANPQLASSAGSLLVRNSPPLAKKVMDSTKPGAMLLALTAAGKSQASRIYDAKRPLTFWQKLSGVPRSDWIALGALFVSALSAYFSYLAVRSQ